MRLYTLIAGAAFAALCTASSASAQSSDDAFLTCAGETDSLLRLICYDEAVGELRRMRGAAPSSAPAATTRAPSAPYRVGGGTTSAEVITGTVTPAPRTGIRGESAAGTFGVYAMARSGRDIAVQLDNGQIWRQIDGKDFDLPRDRDNLTAELTPAFQDSFFMTVSEGPTQRIRKMRVRRVK